MKCIRNNWLTDKCGELEYEFDGKVQIARWSDLKMLYKVECNSLIKLSKLTEVSISPKPIERQKVCIIFFFNVKMTILSFHIPGHFITIK